MCCITLSVPNLGSKLLVNTTLATSCKCWLCQIKLRLNKFSDGSACTNATHRNVGFRPVYVRLCELRVLVPSGTPRLAVTATATKKYIGMSFPGKTWKDASYVLSPPINQTSTTRSGCALPLKTIYHTANHNKTVICIACNRKRCCSCCVCYSCSGMGVNFSSVNSTIHYVPRSIEIFFQELLSHVGRSGQPATSILYLKPSDAPLRKE